LRAAPPRRYAQIAGIRRQGEALLRMTVAPAETGLRVHDPGSLTGRMAQKGCGTAA